MSRPIPQLTRKVRIATMSVFLGFGLVSCADESEQMEEPIQSEGFSQEELEQDENVSLEETDGVEVADQEEVEESDLGEDIGEVDEDLVIQSDDQTPLEEEEEAQEEAENKDFLVDDSIEEDSSLPLDESMAGDQEEQDVMIGQEEPADEQEALAETQKDQAEIERVSAPVEAEQPEETANVATNSGNNGRYIIQKGDTLGVISTRIYGTAKRWSELAAQNNIQDPTKIFPGDELSFELIGQAAERFAEQLESITKKVVVVEAGDTLGSIAKQVLGANASWKQIYAYNKDQIQDPNVIQIGMRLNYVASEEMAQVSGVNGSPQNSEAENNEEFAAQGSE